MSGTTVGAARATTKAAARALGQPVVASAVRAGRLSAVQAEMVTAAVAADAGAAARLVDLAGHAGVKGLRTECDRVIAAAASHARSGPPPSTSTPSVRFGTRHGPTAAARSR